MQEHVGQELIEMEVARHEEMETEHRIQINTPSLENHRCYESQQIHDKKVLGHRRYIVHFAPFCYLLNDSFIRVKTLISSAKLRKISRFQHKNEAISMFFQ